MLYLGHFSFDRLERRRRSSEPWHGYFTCVVEATDMDDALARFRRLVLSLHKTDRELFEDVTEVHLEACVEIQSVPRAGFLAFYNVLEGEDRGGISTAIRGATEHEAVAVRMGATDEPDDEEAHEVQPFVVFQPTRRRDRRRRRPSVPDDTSGRVPRSEAVVSVGAPRRSCSRLRAAVNATSMRLWRFTRRVGSAACPGGRQEANPRTRV